jgi:hypothetical protein
MLRDFLLALIVLVVILFLLRGDSFRFDLVMTVPVALHGRAGGHPLPLPVLLPSSQQQPSSSSSSSNDNNNNNVRDMLVATRDYSVEIWTSTRIDNSGSGSGGNSIASRKSATRRAESSTLSGSLRVATGRAVKAMASGRLQLNTSDAESIGIAVVTDSFVVLCYDRDLRLMWESHVRDHLPTHWHLQEVAVIVTHHSMLIGDKGSIVVAGRLAPDVLRSVQHVAPNASVKRSLRRFLEPLRTDAYVRSVFRIRRQQILLRNRKNWASSLITLSMA